MKNISKSAIKHLISKDEILKDIVLSITDVEFKSTGNVFHDLMSCIIEQQIHYRSTKNIFNNRLKIAGLSQLRLDNFERFERIALKDIKLSSKKHESIAAILDFFESNSINWNQ